MKQVLSWFEVDRSVDAISRSLLPNHYSKGVIAVTRGGLVPAAMLTQRIPVRRIETVCIQSYEGMEQTELKLLNNPNVEDDGKGWVVIDDIVDSGATFRYLRKMWPLATYCSVVTKLSSINVMSELSVDPSVWVVFPWERD